MLRYFDIRIASSGGLAAAIRWLELSILVAFSAASVFTFHPYGLLVALPLAIVAVMLIPGRPYALVAREQARFDALNDLQKAGYDLRARWLKAADQPLSQETAMAQWEVRRDTLIWMSRSKEKLSQFPEIAGIFQARDGQADLMEDLESALQTLSRLRRLVSLSRSLKLPI